MAAIAAILGGTLGFLVALTGLIFFHANPIQALSLWSGTGIITLISLTVLAQTARTATPVRA